MANNQWYKSIPPLPGQTAEVTESISTEPSSITKAKSTTLDVVEGKLGGVAGLTSIFVSKSMWARAWGYLTDTAFQEGAPLPDARPRMRDMRHGKIPDARALARLGVKVYERALSYDSPDGETMQNNEDGHISKTQI
ncbi:hypothetical protein CC2G_012281 [Coprinopsis cinerea AmutBmut pab1-1]|nr:hypothetical protein CC2G_012281 [Coprinopsis cinerea AmutBmut pab1-1]